MKLKKNPEIQKIISITKPDGFIAVAYVLENEQKVLSEWLKQEKLSETDVVVREISANDLPADKDFRNAWKDNGKKISIDMAKAREIHMNKIRAVRDEKLKELDIETLKGRNVQAKKQALRDIPQTFDLSKAKTPEEIKALWPEELKP